MTRLSPVAQDKAQRIQSSLSAISSLAGILVDDGAYKNGAEEGQEPRLSISQEEALQVAIGLISDLAYLDLRVLVSDLGGAQS